MTAEKQLQELTLGEEKTSKYIEKYTHLSGVHITTS